jgi:hypothetical protein
MTGKAVLSKAWRRILIVAFYICFALGVYIIHGPHPPISIDHIAYFKLADQIRDAHPQHDYWRAASVTHSYAVLMCYLGDLSGDHVKTLKILLAVMTVAYLCSAERLFALFATHRWVAVLIAVVSAFHVSFGSVFWGVTDFAASLNRTLVVPPMLLLLAWYFGNYPRRRRFLTYPALVFLSILHLGTYYLLAVLAAMDGVRLIRDVLFRRERLSANLASYAAAFLLVALAYLSIEPLNLTRNVLTMLLPRVEQTTHPAVSLSQSPPMDGVLSSRDAWAMEIFAQPWRNFPLPFATILAALMSLAVILPIAIGSGFLAIRKTGWRPADKPMLLMAASVVFCAYSLQCTLWVVRQFIPIYPVNFEEVRTVSFVYLPILYFIMRGFEWAWFQGGAWESKRLAVLGIILVLLQPIVIVRVLPRVLRERIFDAARQMGVLDQRESQRNMYARQVLRIESAGHRFYYSMVPMISWLRTHAGPEQRILTNRDDLFLLRSTVVGTSNGFLNLDIRSPLRLIWHQQVLELDAALAAKDSQRVRELARKYDIDYTVLPWTEEGAAFSNGGFSIIVTR